MISFSFLPKSFFGTYNSFHNTSKGDYFVLFCFAIPIVKLPPTFHRAFLVRQMLQVKLHHTLSSVETVGPCRRKSKLPDAKRIVSKKWRYSGSLIGESRKGFA